MKKILISLLTLFYLNAFAGEIGYIWIPDANRGLDQAMSEYGIDLAYSKLYSYENLPNINHKFVVDNKIYIIKNKKYLESIIDNFRILKKEGFCDFSTFSTLDFYKGNNPNCSFLNETIKLKKKYNEDVIYISNNKLEVKLIDIIRYIEGTFFEIEIINKGELIND